MRSGIPALLLSVSQSYTSVQFNGSRKVVLSTEFLDHTSACCGRLCLFTSHGLGVFKMFPR